MTYDPNNPFGGAVAGGLQEGDPYPISGGDYAAPAVPEYNPLLGLNCPMGGVTDENGNCPSGMTPEAEQAELDRQAEEKRLAEEKRIADEKAAADKLAADEAARVAEEQRITEETRLVEEKRVADEEAQKIADQQKQPFAGAEAGALNAQDIYNEYGILPSQTPLPYSSFQHDLPLGIRIGENEYYQAQTPEEFKRMVELAQENQKYLASPTNQIYDPDTRTWSLPLTAPVIRTAKDLEDWVNQSKTFESDFVESLNYWQVQKSRLTRQEEAQTRIAGVKASYNDEAGQPVYEGINAAYAARAKKLPLYPAAEIERSLKQLTDGYTLFVNQKIPDSFKVTPTGTSVGADFRTKPNLKIEFNGVDINDPNIKLTPSQITQAKKEAESNPQMFARLLQQAGGHPITRELVKGMYPDLSNEEVVLLLGKQQGLTTSTGNGIPEKINPNTKYPYEQPPVLALDLLNRWTGFKVGAEAPWADKENDYKRRMADMFSDPTIPNIGKNLLLSIGAGLYEGSIKPIFSVMQSVFSTISVLATETERTQGAGERISFDAYDPPAGIPGVIPNNELTRFLGLTKKELVSTMIGFIPLEALPGAGRSFGKALDKNKLIEGIAVDIADGMSHKQIVNAWGVRAKELDINLGTAIEDAKKLFKQTIKDAMYPPEIKVKQTVPANPGEPVPIKDLSPDGTTKTVEVTARRIDDPSTPVKPESIIEQNGQKYQIVEPKPTEVPATESVAPAGTPTVKGTGALPKTVRAADVVPADSPI
jgi:chemotaxis protein histidine kinase CheA